MEDRDYLHGYSHDEQMRLIEQARVLEPYIYEGIDFSKNKKILEVGCGVGAQTEILLNKFPHLKIHGVDVSQAQIALAKERLNAFIEDGRLELTCADATDLSSVEGEGFDAIYICWFLEHVYEPIKVLEAVKKRVGVGCPIYITEVNNSSLFIDPYSPHILEYWNQFNDYQWTIQGHPFVGLQLANMLKSSGYTDIVTKPRYFLFDARNPEERTHFLKYFFGIFKSANDNLVRKGRIHHELIQLVEKDFDAAAANPNSVFYYSYIHTTALT
ncbi:MAG: methyltransferase [Bdellovibrionales bacterium]|nr:methyltransferase [Bdellovibrionales bacterium]